VRELGVPTLPPSGLVGLTVNGQSYDQMERVVVELDTIRVRC
jgi:hypothetical protein